MSSSIPNQNPSVVAVAGSEMTFDGLDAVYCVLYIAMAIHIMVNLNLNLKLDLGSGWGQQWQYAAKEGGGGGGEGVDSYLETAGMTPLVDLSPSRRLLLFPVREREHQPAAASCSR